MVQKICLFSSLTSCSDHPIAVEVEPSPPCSGNVKISYNLPHEYGKPILSLTSCNHQPCSNLRKQREIMRFRENVFTFTKLIDFSENTNFELRVFGSDCSQESCLLPFNVSLISNCDRSFANDIYLTTTNTDIGASSATHSRERPTSAAIIFTVLGILLAGIMVVLGLVVKSKIKARIPRTKQEEKKIKAKVMNAESKTVFIVFTDNHPLHRDVVLKFATLLEADYGFKVVLELYDQQKVYMNPTAWLEKSLDSDQILVIWSPGAAKLIKINSSVNKQNMFLPVIKKMKEDIMFKKDTSKYSFVYFDYCNAKDLETTEYTQNISTFQIASELERLLAALTASKFTNLNSRSRKIIAIPNETEQKIIFDCALSKMCSFVKSNPRWYE